MKRLLLCSSLMMLSSLYSSNSYLQLRHKESQGIGYHKGYTSLDYFFISDTYQYDYLLNLRGHIFNDRGFASNLGLGIRYPFSSAPGFIGGNLFYDFRKHPYLNGHQIGIGFEWLSEQADLRLNGYLPVGTKKDVAIKTFECFRNHTLMTAVTLTGFLPCIEGELGRSFFSYNAYLAVGAYYLFSRNSAGIKIKNTMGTKVRGEYRLNRYFNLGASLTYDASFRTRLEGVIMFNIPLTNNQPYECCPKVYQHSPIVRHEIIPLQCRSLVSVPLKNRKNKDISFLFVKKSMAQPGNGTVEKPFQSLKEAETRSKPGDMIYVFAGENNDPIQLDSEVSLKKDQRLVSSGVPVIVEDVIIPPQTPGKLPILTGPKKIIKNSVNPDLSGFTLQSWQYFDNQDHLFMESHLDNSMQVMPQLVSSELMGSSKISAQQAPVPLDFNQVRESLEKLQHHRSGSTSSHSSTSSMETARELNYNIIKRDQLTDLSESSKYASPKNQISDRSSVTASPDLSLQHDLIDISSDDPLLLDTVRERSSTETSFVVLQEDEYNDLDIDLMLHTN